MIEESAQGKTVEEQRSIRKISLAKRLGRRDGAEVAGPAPVGSPLGTRIVNTRWRASPRETSIAKRHLSLSSMRSTVERAITDKATWEAKLPSGVEGESIVWDHTNGPALRLWTGGLSLTFGIQFGEDRIALPFAIARRGDARGPFAEGAIRMTPCDGAADHVAYDVVAAIGANATDSDETIETNRTASEVGDLSLGLMIDMLMRVCAAPTERADAIRDGLPNIDSRAADTKGDALDDEPDEPWEEPAVPPTVVATMRRTLAEDAPSTPLALYTIDDVEAAMALDVVDDKDTDSKRSAANAKRHALARRGVDGARRRLAHATEGTVRAIRDAVADSPHLAELGGLYERYARLSIRTNTPMRTPPVLLIGRGGIGKSRFMRLIGDAMGVPQATSNMNGTSLCDRIAGSSPNYVQAAPGIVATALLRHDVANPAILVDEFDKAESGNKTGDPYRPFYTLLEPENARGFIDDYLGFPMRADGVQWIMTANDATAVPELILSRLARIEVPDIRAEDMARILDSIYAEQNAEHNGWFEERIDSSLRDLLIGETPRRARIRMREAMARAAAEDRKRPVARDAPDAMDAGSKNRMGFTA